MIQQKINILFILKCIQHYNIQTVFYKTLLKIHLSYESDGWGGEVFLIRSKRRRHLLKIRIFKSLDNFIFWTDRQTDRQAENVVHREVAFPNMSIKKSDFSKNNHDILVILVDFCMTFPQFFATFPDPEPQK